MTELVILFLVILASTLVLTLFVPAPGSTGVQLTRGVIRRGEDRRTVMDRIARWVVLGLGRATFAALHLFEYLGVNVATLDQVLADWTAYANDLKAQRDAAVDGLTAAQAAAQASADALAAFQADDAATDAQQIADQAQADADAAQAALDAVKNPPTPPVDEPTDPPVEDPTAGQ